MGTLVKSQKEIVKIKNTVPEMNNAFEAFISGLNTDEETISDLENRSIKTLQTEIEREK